VNNHTPLSNEQFLVNQGLLFSFSFDKKYARNTHSAVELVFFCIFCVYFLVRHGIGCQHATICNQFPEKTPFQNDLLCIDWDGNELYSHTTRRNITKVLKIFIFNFNFTR